MGRRSLTAVFCAVMLAVPAGNAYALTRTVRGATAKTKVVVETVTGPVVKCHRWGFMVVQLTVRKTEVTSGGHTSVAFKITGVNWPTFPNHTPRSIYINQLALPLLQGLTLQLDGKPAAAVQVIAGATNTTDAWRTSLQAALLKASTP